MAVSKESRVEIKPEHMGLFELLCAAREGDLSPAVIHDELQRRKLEDRVEERERFWNAFRAAMVLGGLFGFLLCYVFAHISRP